jgi:tRNA-modifying protein YgfZ
MRAAVLLNRGIVRVSGPDAASFLDDIVTCTVKGLPTGQARHGALLSPQGKVLFDFILVEAPEDLDGGFYLDTPVMTAGALAERLAFYKLRAKVEIADLSADMGVLALMDGPLDDPEALGLCYLDPRVAAMGWRVIAHKSQFEAVAEEAGAAMVGAEEHMALRIRHAVPEVAFDFQYGEVFPHELNMDQLGGVDFRKGCYVGQEVVSRMQHRGTARTRLIRVRYDLGLTVNDGVEVLCGEVVAGRTGSSVSGEGLVLARLDRIAEAFAAGTVVTAGGLGFTPVKPDWWSVDWPFAVATS